MTADRNGYHSSATKSNGLRWKSLVLMIASAVGLIALATIYAARDTEVVFPDGIQNMARSNALHKASQILTQSVSVLKSNLATGEKVEEAFLDINQIKEGFRKIREFLNDVKHVEDLIGGKMTGIMTGIKSNFQELQGLVVSI